MLPVVNKLVAALAGVKTSCPSPGPELSIVAAAPALGASAAPVAQTSVPAALKVKVLSPPAVSID